MFISNFSPDGVHYFAQLGPDLSNHTCIGGFSFLFLFSCVSGTVDPGYEGF